MKGSQDNMDNGLLLAEYQQQVTSGAIHYDARQWLALQTLQQVFDQISKVPKRIWLFTKSESIKGVYLFGKVGTGKTFTLDLFYRLLPVQHKMRIHFHAFMQMVHDRLKILEGNKNPLKILAKEIANQAKVICLDEFIVENIVDAMILANLLKALYEQDIVLISTSNTHPDELYKNGIQRDRFIPAIELIKQHNHLIEVNSGIDYRLEKADYEHAYFYPQSSEHHEFLLERFKQVSGADSIQYFQKIILCDRPVDTLYTSPMAVWFDFLKICGVPRSTHDYLELSEKFRFIFIDNLRHIGAKENDLVANFINLVDVFYDKKTKLYISASVDLFNIYTEGRYEAPFQRTISRLQEMQGEEYLKL